MEKDYLIKLTVAVYKVTELFPEREPLRYQIRQKANEILAGLIREGLNPGAGDELLKDIEIINVYFEIADYHHWVNEKNLAILEQEYSIFADRLQESPRIKEKAVLEGEKKEKTSKESFNPVFPKISRKKRREKIVNLLNYKRRINLSELRKIFPGISSRTIRRDMELLISEGIVFRQRDGQKDVSYQSIEKRSVSGQ